MRRIRRALEHGEKQRCPFAPVTQDVEDFGEIKSIGTVHGVPPDRLHEGITRKSVLLALDVSEGQIGIETVKRRPHLHERAWITFYAAVCKALEGVREAEILHLVGGGELRLHILLDGIAQLEQGRQRGLDIALSQEILYNG